MLPEIKKAIHTICYYILIAICIDGICGILFIAGMITILRLIALLYIFNILVIPIFMAIIGIRQIRTEPNSRTDGILKCILSAIFFGIFVYVSLIEPENIRIEKHSIFSPKVTDTVTLIHISDIQSDNVGEYERKVFDMLGNIPCDITLNTGDLVQPFYFSGYDVSRYKPELRKISMLFKKLQPPHGIFNVMGDTELPRRFFKFDKLSGVKTLKNKHVIVKTPGGTLDIMGLSLANSRKGAKIFVNNWIKQGNNDHVKIVMGHAPDYIKTLLNAPVDLCLAGHTHGGADQFSVNRPSYDVQHNSKGMGKRFQESRNHTFQHFSRNRGEPRLGPAAYAIQMPSGDNCD
ncbi:MAG: hypothetical protein GY749_25880 [Desulfobacteraceae bacterium]|nr:hypothetical protein [Desulfobacteraceae bacterium]